MKWKDSNDSVELGDEAGPDPKTGQSFSMKKDNGIYPSALHTFQGKKMPTLLVGGGVLVLVVLIVWLFFGSGDNTGLQQINSLETRVKALESRLASLEPLAGATTAGAQQEKSVAELTKRIDWLEAVFTKEIDSLSKQLAAVKPQKAAAPAPVKPASSQPAAAAAGVQKANTHVVQAGENLYRISRRYNLKLEELLRLNNLKPDAALQPGQKLVVSSPKP